MREFLSLISAALLGTLLNLAAQEFAEKYKVSRQRIIKVLSFVVPLGLAYPLWSNEGALRQWHLVVIGGLAAFIGVVFCGYIRFRRKISTFDVKTRVYASSGKSRSLAGWGMILIPILTVILTGGWLYYRSLPPTKIIILVSTLDSADPNRRQITSFLSERLREALAHEPDIEIKQLRTTIEGGAKAYQIGKEYKARMVIWGRYAAQGNTIRTNLYMKPLQSPIEARNIRLDRRLTTVVEFDSPSFEADLTSDLTYLVEYLVGLIHYSARNYDKAEFSLENARARVPNGVDPREHGTLLFYIGNTHFFQYDNSSAVESYLAAENEGFDDPDLFVKRGHAYRYLEDLKSAETAYNRALVLDDNNADAYYGIGMVQGARGDRSDAIVAFTRAITESENFADAYLSRGGTFSDLGQYEQAHRDYDEAEALDPNEPLVNLYRAHTFMNQGDEESAREQFNLLIQRIDETPEQRRNAEFYYNRGFAHMRVGNSEDAINNYTLALELDPAMVGAYVNRGNMLQEQGRIEEAIDDFNKAILLAPDSPIPYYNLGNAYRQLQDYTQARDNYIKAIDRNSNYIDAYANLGLTYMATRQSELAIEAFSKAIDLGSNEPYLYNFRGIAFWDLEKLDQALQNFSDAIDLYPTSIGPRLNRAQLYYILGKHSLACDDLQMATPLAKDDEQREFIQEWLNRLETCPVED